MGAFSMPAISSAFRICRSHTEVAAGVPLATAAT